MKMDDFEQRLQRQPMRQIPAEWRGEILSAAKCASRPATRGSFLSTISYQLSTLLWPHPKAWAGLAAVWILIFAVDFSMRDTTPARAEKAVPPSPEVVAELQLEWQMRAELIGARDISEADRSKLLSPQPRSERVEILMT